MPYKPRVPCKHLGCPALIESGAGTCEAHRKAEHKADRDARGSAQQRGYDSRWNKYRKIFLSQYPLCIECEKAGRVVAAEIVDHIIPLAQGGSMYDESNHQSLCRSHHQEKTARETRG